MSSTVKEQLISLGEASEFCPHSQEYLSLRARQKKLKAVKINRTWFTTKIWLREYLAKEYITLQEATRLCPYTQEYLSLRARQGKLRAVKIGRNWRTTKQWLHEYIAKSKDYKKSLEAKKIADSLSQSNQHAVGQEKASAVSQVDPPPNLPVFAPEADAWEFPTAKEIAKRFAFWHKVRLAGATAFVLALVVFALVQEYTALYKPAEQSYKTAYTVAKIAEHEVHTVGYNAGTYMAAQHTKVSETFLVASVSDVINEYVGWLANGARAIAGWFVAPFQKESEFVAAPPPVLPAAPQAEKKGMLVVPSTDDNERVKEQVKQSFSDEVRVTPQDEESGIITPVFRERAGEDYLYILVPLQENEQ